MRCKPEKVPGNSAPSPDERGASAVEYAFMAGLIAAVIVVGVTALGQGVVGLFTSALVYPFGP